MPEPYTTQLFEPVPNVLIRLCVEDTRLTFEKGAYSIASMIFQYIVPVVIVSVAHARICNKLKYRMVNQRTVAGVAIGGISDSGPSPFQKRKTRRQAVRKRRTNMLLVGIALAFAFSWMPLNVFNILADFGVGHMHRMAMDTNETFAVCHLLVLASACTNPVLYGWLNENFRREFKQVLRITGSGDSGCGRGIVVVGGGGGRHLGSSHVRAAKLSRVIGSDVTQGNRKHAQFDNETSRLNNSHLAVGHQRVESTYEMTTTDIRLQESADFRSTVSV